jgi:hypothetical protein
MAEQDTPVPEGTPAAPAPGTPEYDAAMASKFNSQLDTPAPPKDDVKADVKPRPEHVPEKYWDAKTGTVNVEALLKSNSELEKKFTQQKQQPKETSKETDKATDDAALSAADVLSAATEEFANDGALSDDMFDKLEKVGYPRAMVEDYIAGQTARAENYESNIKSLVGGPEAYDKMAEWARTNLDDSEREAFNEAVRGKSAEFAVKGLYARYAAASKTPNLISGKSGAVGGEVFRSKAELVSAMKDARYQKDPAYRADVEAKLKRSNLNW